MNDRASSAPSNEKHSTKRARVRGTPKGRSVDPKAREEVRALLKDAPLRRDLLIEHLHRIQDRYGHLSAAHLVALADEMKLSMTEVYEVATFYHHFDVIKEGDTAPPAITVCVCDSLSCEIAGADDLLKKLPGILGQDVRVLPAPCIGRCETAPAAVVAQNPVPHASVEKIAALVKAKALRHPPAVYIDYAAYNAKGGYELAKACIEGAKKREDVVAVMENSGLRGLGGAGFPAGRKWKSVAAEPAPRLMAINIDEGEPGTFKDRWYLERDPHRFIEGALVAAWAVGIDEIYVYLRDEYHGCRAILEREIAALHKNPPCKLPPIHLRRGAGANICGEESAMIAEYCGGMREGHLFYAYLPGGASGGILPASMADIPLDFDTLNQYGCFIGSAAVVILSDKDRATAAARNLTKFFSEESCGQCTPCRVGAAKTLKLIEKSKWDQPLLKELSQAMMDASICGLGQAAPNPVLSVMKYFPQEIQQEIA